MIINMECVAGMREHLADNSVDAVVCDPPYGLSKEPDMAEVLRHWLAGDDYEHTGNGFMGNSWDSFVPGPSVWKEVFRVLKPGGHLLAFFGSRTYDLGTTAIRLAGFEIRDQIMWVYGSGFPKSLDISKAIDKAAGAEREKVGEYDRRGAHDGANRVEDINEHAFAASRQSVVPVTAPATDAAVQWAGWGTALKPAHEPIVMARKPFKGTVAANVQDHGTGALNIDGCRITDGTETGKEKPEYKANNANAVYGAGMGGGAWENIKGRWPANFVHDGLTSEPWSQYFYCPKTSKQDRNEGVYGDHKSANEMVHRKEGSAGLKNARAGAGRTSGAVNHHPTVKPTALMQWLVRLVTPPGGLVLDPFAGSGSTGKACGLEGFRFIGFEMDADYAAIAVQRERFGKAKQRKADWMIDL